MEECIDGYKIAKFSFLCKWSKREWSQTEFTREIREENDYTEVHWNIRLNIHLNDILTIVFVAGAIYIIAHYLNLSQLETMTFDPNELVFRCMFDKTKNLCGLYFRMGMIVIFFSWLMNLLNTSRFQIMHH